MVLIMIWYYHCWISYPTYDMEEDQVDESLISIDTNKWNRDKNILYTVRLAGHDTKLLDFD